MLTGPLSDSEVAVRPTEAKDITTCLRYGTSHADYPPLERFATIDCLLKSHAAQPDEAQIPLICYPITGAADFEEHTASNINRYTDITAHYYIQRGLSSVDPITEEAPVVALLVGSSFEVILTIFALNRLGYAVLFLSTRLRGTAHARLLEMANCRQLIISEQYERNIQDIRETRPSYSSIPMLQRSDWFDFPAGASCFRRPKSDLSREGKKTAWILHSSGSTGFPKPIFLTNSKVLANFRKSFGFRAFNVSPLFHSHALMQLGRAFYTRATLYLGNHSLPVTYQNLCDALQVAQPQQISAVPYVIKLLAEKPEGVQLLAKAKLVLYGGSSFPDNLGNLLVSQGVNLVGNYGTTETGQIMTSFRQPGDTDWQHMRLRRPISDHILMDEISPGLFECVALDGLPSKGPSNSKPPFSEKNPEHSFRTADLFLRHPDTDKSNYYKYISRLDDRITLVNGEKVLPIPIEGRIREEELVRECVVFGIQRTVPGALIFRAADKAPHLSDGQFLEVIWPAVEAANSRAETFSHIPKELVVVKNADVVYPRTDKGTIIRRQVYQQFAQDIEAAYANFGEEGRHGGELLFSISEMENWLLSRFREDLGVPLSSPVTDIFSAGVDSLQAMQMWRYIVQNLDIGGCGEELSQNIVFEKGTVRALAKYLYHRRTGQEVMAENEVLVMKEMIEKYSRFTQHYPTIQEQPEGELVIVTGATGNLGVFILTEILKRSTVSEVWALVRAPGQAAAGARLWKALADRNIILTDEEAAKVHAIPSDLSQPNLGLSGYVLEHLLSSLTCVIHSAWSVNFNLGVRSFEQQHVRGTHNLINFCLRSKTPSPAQFFICSSVSVASNFPKPASISETVIENLNHAQMGYGRSKLVAEHITRNAMRQTGMQARVLRIGQLSGDTGSARWNDSEAPALMLRSVLTTGALPKLDERLSWLPVDKCAQVVVDLAMRKAAASEDIDLVYHVVNQRTFSWENDLLPTLKQISALPSFEVVPTQEWLRRLAATGHNAEKNPSIKLLNFWRSKYIGNCNPEKDKGSVERKETSGLTFETDRTVQDCPYLALVRDPVAEGLVKRYIENWMQRWSK